ncbi:MAG: alpha/beta hydrolase [Microcoleus sp. CSU_2_2]|nr:alpha/beta hydrolase [Microcoleus sp. SU_5_3]NJS10115.1 alpha/beta hydrolase [Microcoleus sp. CSU_2_2]
MNKLIGFILPKSLVAIGTFLAIAYSAACVFLFTSQSKFIFFPTRAIETTPDDLQLRYQNVVLPISSKNGAVQSVHGWWIPASKRSANQDESEKVVLYLHGNGLNAGANVEHANRFHRLGLSVFLIDYRGYGQSQGDFPTESQVYQDAQLAWDYLVKKRGINPKQIYIYGHSLGGAIAIDLAVRHPEAAGLIVEGSFTSTRAMVDFQKGLYWMFPIDLLLTQRFDSISKVDRLQMPILFIHGTADTIVPVEMGRKLFDRAPEPKQLYIVPGADHNNLAQFAGAEYLQRVRQFLEQTNKIKN